MNNTQIIEAFENDEYEGDLRDARFTVTVSMSKHQEMDGREKYCEYCGPVSDPDCMKECVCACHDDEDDGWMIIPVPSPNPEHSTKVY